MNLESGVARLVVLLVLAAMTVPAARQAYDPLKLLSDRAVPTFDLVVDDARRDRRVPVRLYLPASTAAAPVVLFSHGLGGSREGNAFMGRHWAARGYVAVFLQHPGARPVTPAVGRLGAEEQAAGLTGPARYAGFSRDVARLRAELVGLLRRLRGEGRRLAAYGAPAKGTILLNACGIGTDLLEFTVDRSPHKQGRLVPGVRLPIRPVESLLREMPDVTLLLPWNLADEIFSQQAEYLRKGGTFLLPVPTPRVIGADDLR